MNPSTDSHANFDELEGTEESSKLVMERSAIDFRDKINNPQYVAAMVVNILDRLRLSVKNQQTSVRNYLRAKAAEMKFNRDLFKLTVGEIKDIVSDARKRAIMAIREMFPNIKDVSLEQMIEGVSMLVDLYRYIMAFANAGKKLNEKVCTELILALFEEVLYIVVRRIAEDCNSSYEKTFEVIYGCTDGLKIRNEKDDIAHTLKDLWGEDNQSKCRSLYKHDRGATFMKGSLCLDEQLKKAGEWVSVFSRTARFLKLELSAKETITIILYVDPGIFHPKLSHYRVNGLEVEDVEVYNAKARVNELKDAAVKCGFIDEKNIDKVEVISDYFSELHRYYHLDGNGIHGLQYPDMLKKIIDQHVKAFLELKFADKFTDSDKMMIRHTIDRSFLGFYAWMNDKEYNFISIKANRTTILDNDKLKEYIPQHKVYRIVMPQVRLAILRYGRYFPVKITKKECEELGLFSKLPSCKDSYWSEEDNCQVNPLYDDHRSSILKHGSNKERDHIYMWIYARDEAARQEFIKQRGDVQIDGVRFILIIYNPNADFKRTRFDHLRGCWFMVKKTKDTNFNFFMLTRSMLDEIYEDVLISTTASFQLLPGSTDVKGKEPTIVNYTYRGIAVPPVMDFAGLLNNFDELVKHFEKENSEVSYQKDGKEVVVGNKVVSDEEYTELFFKKYGHQENAKEAIFVFHETLAEVYNVEKIHMYVPEGEQLPLLSKAEKLNTEKAAYEDLDEEI